MAISTGPNSASAQDDAPESQEKPASTRTEGAQLEANSGSALMIMEHTQIHIAQLQQEIDSLEQRVSQIAATKKGLGLPSTGTVDPETHRLVDEKTALRHQLESARQEYEVHAKNAVAEMRRTDVAARSQYEEERRKIYSPDELAELEKTIERIYSQKPVWHGTGRRRYAHKGASKYDGVDFDKPTFDVLRSILATGLAPQYDPWGKSSAGKAATLSVTETRQVAKVVACTRIPEGEKLRYEFGSSRFWWVMLMKKQNMEVLYVHPDGIPTAKKSMRELNRNVESMHVTNYNDIYADIRSTIPDNYPVIFGIKPDLQAGELQGITISGDFERRSTETAGIDSMTHVEVPLKNVAETKKLLAELNIQLPVIPIEEGERYFSKKNERLVS